MKKIFLIIVGVIVLSLLILVVRFRIANSQPETVFEIVKDEDYKETIDNSIDPKLITSNVSNHEESKEIQNDQLNTEIIDSKTIYVMASSKTSKRVYFYNEPDLNSKMEKTYFVNGQKALNMGSFGEFTKIDFEYNGKHTIGYVLNDEITFLNNTGD